MTTRRSVLGFLATLWPTAALSTPAAAQSPPPTVLAPSAPGGPLNVSTGSGMQACADYAIGAAVAYTYSYLTATSETAAAPLSTPVTAVQNALNPGLAAGCGFTITASTDASVTGMRVFRKVNGSWTKYRDFPNTTSGVVDVTGLLTIVGQPRVVTTACFVCGSADIRDLALNVSGETVDDQRARTVVRRDLPIEQYCGYCGTKRIRLSSL